MKDICRKIVTILLALCFIFQGTTSIFGEVTKIDKDNTEDYLGKIKIISGYTSENSWNAVVHKSGKKEYVIMLRPEDIATITGYNLVTNNKGYMLENGSYEVYIYNDSKTAEVIMNFGSGLTYSLYGGEFELSDVIEWEYKDGTSDIYVPLEEIFYLLNTSWVPMDNCVTTVTPKDTLLTIMGDYIEMCNSVPNYSDIMGETGGEVVSNIYMYTALLLADDIDWRLCFNLTSNDKIEDSLLELNTSAIACLEESECDMFGSYINNYYTPVNETIEFSENLLDLGESVSKGFKKELIESISGIKFSDNVEVENSLMVASLLLKGIDVYQTSTRYTSWSESYLSQLKYLSELDKHYDDYNTFEFESNIINVSTSLYNEYGNELKTAANEWTGVGIDILVDEVVGSVATPVKIVQLSYDLAVLAAKSTIPIFNEALNSAEYAMKAKVDRDVATYISGKYITEMETLLENGITAESLKNVRTTGILMTNAAAHSWKNMYYLNRNMNKETGNPIYYTQANCGYVNRFIDSELYDNRLIKDTSYSNLYTMDISDVGSSLPEGETARIKIPEEYVQEENYYTFIRDELLPELGYANLETTTKYVSSDTAWTEDTNWDKREGLVGADITDMNSDGVDDLLVYYLTSSKSNYDYCTLYADLYTLSEDNSVFLVDSEEMITYYTDVSYDCTRIGLMEKDGHPYLHLEVISTAYFADGYYIMYSWFGYDGTKLRPYWKVGKTDGGSSEIVHSLLTYSDDDNYNKQVLWAGRSYGDAGKCIEKGFFEIGLGESQKEYYIDSDFSIYDESSETFPSYWNTSYLTKSIEYLCKGSGSYSSRNMEISLTDETELQKHIEELDD